RKFPEIVVDSIYFYNLSRGLLFVEYHQAKPLKPSAEISLYTDSIPVYSKEHARIYGIVDTHIEDKGWENGPESSVYSNIHYSKKDRQFILLQRIPYNERNIAFFISAPRFLRKGNGGRNIPTVFSGGLISETQTILRPYPLIYILREPSLPKIYNCQKIADKPMARLLLTLIFVLFANSYLIFGNVRGISKIYLCI
ncbi:MAG: hypothetical protein K2G77_03900, partial [Muribaculaceae bacterium]|nr:hypothetical protein [Muribaculaceae bacterium]